MLSALETHPQAAYEVPWRIDRISDTHPLIINRSGEPVEAVRIFSSDQVTLRWGLLDPGESVDLCLCGVDLDDLVLTICWFRSSTQIEYVWRFVM